jgi:uncharacterized protein
MTSQTMHSKCIKCGSENIRISRIRQRGRTLSMLFLRSLRCHDCRARYWVPHKKAYLLAGVAFFCGLLLTYFIFMSILMPDQNIVRSQKLDPGGSDMMVNTTTKLRNDSEFDLNPKSAISITVPRESETIAKTKTNIKLTELHTDNRHFTVQLYYEKAQKGDADAQYKLGLLYLNGNGTIQDFEEAAKWLELAAEKNHSQAQYQLGLIYKTGFGVDTDLEKSYMWLNLSAAAGVEKAALVRDNIMRSLDPEQLKQAQRASREWLLNLEKGTAIDN